MKILQLSKYYPPTHGGLEIVAEFFSRSSQDLDCEVKVLSLGNSKKKYLGRFKEEVLQSKEDLKIKSSPFSLGYYQDLRNQILSNTPDIIYVHLPNPFAHEVIKLFKDIIKQKKIKVVGVYHSDIVNQVLLRDAYNCHFSRHIDLYDYFICSSSNLKKSSAILSGLPPHKVVIIPFCIENQYQQISSHRPSTFSGKFITVGRMVPYKGFGFLVDSFKNLPYTLTVVGGGPLLEELKSKASTNVKFVGEVNEAEKYELFSKNDALIVSSINRAEAYGMTIVEAFSVGLPVISSNIDTGVSFLVRDGLTGLKFPILDEKELVKQMDKFAKNPELSQKLSREAKDFFEKELSYAAFKKNMKDFMHSFQEVGIKSHSNLGLRK